ncbi:cytochrome c oxidase subunit 3 [Daejeonella rubra]|uniref:Cytochrome c oxidase subunit 3 n=1 Tax=Daejeonella rubra TaxID=990371 RepID=A0A1G9U317_9SPHI|nr:cytochrome c oxidase subunit 3 [Daejeonella rubra]SDM54306.1 cytochrome c oxidase subunit 3 [Daejeonella rubra]
MEIKNVQVEDRQNFKARKFLMWLFIISSFMMFAALTSGFIVYTEGNAERGIKVLLPKAFMYSTLIIIVSSITMHLAYLSAQKLQFGKQKLFIALTILLAIAFFYSQFSAWQVLYESGAYFVNYNASQSFIYVFSGAHLLHIIAGIFMLIYALIGKIRNIPQVRNIFRMEVTSIFWHFIDILWIYLYVFLLLNQ